MGAPGQGNPSSQLADDPRFTTEASRSENKTDLDEIFSAWLKERTKEEAFKILGDAGVPCSPAYDLKEVASHPYLQERGILQEIEDPRFGRMAVISPRIRFAGEPVMTARYAPLLGEHNDEVFQCILGLSRGQNPLA